VPAFAVHVVLLRALRRMVVNGGWRRTHARLGDGPEPPGWYLDGFRPCWPTHQ
jgi:hypothetical protein